MARQHVVQGRRRQADVHDDAIFIQLGPAKFDIDHVGRAVQSLRGAEHLAGKAVGDHHVIANTDRIHSPP